MNRDDIERAYQSWKAKGPPGAHRGWTCFYTPADLRLSAKAVFIGLNPGGSEDEAAYGAGTWDCPQNEYYHGAWTGDPGQSPLQVQIQSLFERLNLGETDVFCGNFVPFRSPGWSDLPEKEDALCLGRRLWSWALQSCPADLFLTMGRLAGAEIAQLKSGDSAPPEPVYLPVNWGRQKLEIYSGAGWTVINLPHLSRYKLFSGKPRPDLEQALASFRRP